MTYSIVARDPDTGAFGVAVQSYPLAVGAIVPWAKAGVGAVATQALAQPSYGPLGIDKMASGASAPDALRALLDADDGSAVRQVAMVDAAGRAAVHTGERAIAEAGHVVGDGWSVQANMMARPTVWDAMAATWESDSGQPFEWRLLAVLDAAEAEGGDIRGHNSAAMLVVSGEAGGDPSSGRLIDLRVDASSDPLAELRRLLRIHAANRELPAGPAEARAAHERFQELMPGNPEPLFWAAVRLLHEGREVEARDLLASVYAVHPPYEQLFQRLGRAGLLPSD